MIPSSAFFRCQAACPHELHALVWQGARQAAPPLFCVHGLTRNGWDFAPLAGGLAATRRVIAPDMAGRGLSDRLEPRHYSYATYIEDCLALMDALGLEEVDWCGTSMGGIIGMMIAARHPRRINKLILNDVGPLIPLAALQRIALYVGGAPDFPDLATAERWARATYADFGIVAAEDWRRLALTSVARKEGGGYAPHYDRRIAEIFKSVAQDVDLWGIYESIQAPTLLLRGARSDLLRADDAEAMTRRGPKATLVTFEGAGHAPGLMEARQIETIAAFLG